MIESSSLRPVYTLSFFLLWKSRSYFSSYQVFEDEAKVRRALARLAGSPTPGTDRVVRAADREVYLHMASPLSALVALEVWCLQRLGKKSAFNVTH